MGKLMVSGWYQSSSSSAASLSDELRSDFWRDIPVLLILVSTGTQLSSKKKNDWLRTNRHRSDSNHFYCFIDGPAAEDVWGSDFCSISRAIKEPQGNRAR